MNLARNRLLFYLLFSILIFSGPFTVFLEMGYDILSINGLLRSSGLIGFTLIFSQIFLGFNMNKMTQLLGSKAYFIHIFLGVSSLIIILLHPIAYSVQSFYIFGKFMPFLIPMNSSNHEFWISFGRVGFLFLFSSIVVAYFRKIHFFRKVWKKVHYINYVAFYFLSVHAWFAGTDSWSMPFVMLFWIYNVIVTYIVLKKVSFTVSPKLISVFKINIAK